MDQDKESGGRLLGAVETLYAAGVELIGASILFSMGVIDTSQELSKDDLEEAARILASKQESLRMKISKESSSGYRFEPLENWRNVKVKLANINSKDDWVTIVHEETNRKFDLVNGPFWEIILAKVNEISTSETKLENRYVLILKFHHSISDAMSAFDALYRQYIPILSAVVNKGDTQSVLSEDIPLQRSIEDVMSLAPLPWVMRQMINFMMWFKGKYSKPQVYSFVYKDDPVRTKEDIESCPGLYPFVFSEKLTTIVLKAAKQHNVSVHSLLIGFISVALSATCSDAVITLPKKLNFLWPVDLRKYFNIGFPQPLCAYIANGASVTKNKFDHTEEEFWKMCREIAKGVKSQNTKEKCSFGLRVFSYIISQHSTDMDSFMEIFAQIGFESFGIISNLGNCDSGPEPKVTTGTVEIKLQEAHFSLTGTQLMEMFPFFYSVTTFNGKIMVNVHYCPKVVSNRFVKNLSLKIQEVAEKYCGQVTEDNASGIS